MQNKAIFFDRDGVVNVKLDNDYVKTIEEFEFCVNFFELFRYLKQQQYLAILVTNQQCIGKGIITEPCLHNIHNYMNKQLVTATQFSFDAIYFCPDLADSGSLTRKPATGMFDLAIKRFNIDVASSWTIGDSMTDIIAGKAVGTRTILISEEFDVVDTATVKPDFIKPNLATVLEQFLALQG